jgi:HPr kinase/phosphorylase
MMLLLHATSISLNGSAVLIRGASGAGKSSLALQLLETQGTGLGGDAIAVALIADDQTQLMVRQGHVFASPPPTLAGLLEVRGQGILKLPFATDVPLALVVDLKPAAAIERLPDRCDLTTEILGIAVPCVAIDPLQPSAAARLRVAWARLKKA